MNRRDAMTTGAAFAAASFAAAACGTKNAVAQGAEHHAHHAQADSPVTAAAYDCVRAGDACLVHCIALLSQGDQSMAGCAASVRDMTAAMNALASISAGGGKRVGEVAKALSKLCEDCIVECQKHAQHPPCRACLEACQRLVAAVPR
jgi:Cys-rich four helix bundle protein (predicted Tat secretion target)